MSGTGIVNAAKENPRSHGDWDSVNNQSRIRDGERIKRIGDWHTDAPPGLKPTLVPGVLNGSGPNCTAAKEGPKNDRTYLKSANSTRYLSHRSRVKEP